PELAPNALSYNSPLGMCQECTGLGTRLEVDPAAIVSDPDRSIAEGAIEPWRNIAAGEQGWTARIVHAVARAYGVPLDKPWKRLGARQRDILLFGSGDRRVTVTWEGKRSSGSWAMRWEGVANQITRRYRDTRSESMRSHYQRYMHEAACSACA